MLPLPDSPTAADIREAPYSDPAEPVRGWTAIESGDLPGQLLVDVSSLHLWRKVERNARFKFIPQSHAVDENRNKTILYELINDVFKCSEGTAQKISITAYYDDGTHQQYWPWGLGMTLGTDWIRVRPDTALSHEMNFVCSVQLNSRP